MSEGQQASVANKGTGTSLETFTSQFASFSKVIVTSMRDISELANNRASTFLLSLGTALLIFTMFWRLRPAGVQVSDLGTPEFITMAIVSALFVLVGSFLRLCQERVMSVAGKEMRDTGAKLLERTHEAALALAQKGTERDDHGL